MEFWSCPIGNDDVIVWRTGHIYEMPGDLTNARLMVTRLEAALAESVSRRSDWVIRYRAELKKELQVGRERLGKLVEGQAGLEDRVRKATLYTQRIWSCYEAANERSPGSLEILSDRGERMQPTK